MRSLSATGAAFFLLSLPAAAEPVSYYTWTGFADGPSLCTTFKMTVNVRIDGNEVRGYFRQDARAPQHFTATLDTNGAFTTEVGTGPRGPAWVSGTIKPGEASVLFDNIKYNMCACRIEAQLEPVTPFATARVLGQ